MTTWRLADTLRYAVCEGRGVFLDLASERYFALPSQADDALQHLLAGTDSTICDEASCELLTSRGILVACETLSATRPSALPPRARQGLEDCGRMKIGLAFRLVRFRLVSSRDLKKGLLFAVNSALASPSGTRNQVTGAEVQSLAASDRFLNHVQAGRDACLPHSLAFVRVCRDLGTPAQLVLGVTAQPFSAHAWVQLGDTVLNDSIERVSEFAPIAAFS